MAHSIRDDYDADALHEPNDETAAVLKESSDIRALTGPFKVRNEGNFLTAPGLNKNA